MSSPSLNVWPLCPSSSFSRMVTSSNEVTLAKLHRAANVVNAELEREDSGNSVLAWIKFLLLG